MVGSQAQREKTLTGLEIVKLLNKDSVFKLYLILHREVTYPKDYNVPSRLSP